MDESDLPEVKLVRNFQVSTGIKGIANNICNCDRKVHAVFPTL